MTATTRADAAERLHPAAKPSGAYRHGDLRNALLDAAAGLVQERGGADFSLREIATRVGVSHAATYRHFDSREALVAALAARGFKAMRARFEAAMAASTEWPTSAIASPPVAATASQPAVALAARIERLGLAYFEAVRTDPGTYRVMFAPLAVIDPECGPAAEACLDILVTAFAQAQTAGLARSDLPPNALAVAAWSSLHGLGMLVIDKRLEDAGSLGGPATLLTALMSTLRDGWQAR